MTIEELVKILTPIAKEHNVIVVIPKEEKTNIEEKTNMEKWQLKILEGMKLIKEGCSKNDSWACCSECPFTDYCDIIQAETLKPPYTPQGWEIENLKY